MLLQRTGVFSRFNSVLRESEGEPVAKPRIRFAGAFFDKPDFVAILRSYLETVNVLQNGHSK